MILSRYMARKYLLTFLGVLAVMTGILLMIDMVEQLRRFAGSPLTLSQAAHLAALRVPQSVYAVLPLVAILSALAMFVGLARSSELVVVRAVGRSALAVVAPAALVALALGAVAVAVLNPVVAATAKQYDVVAARMGADGGSALSLSREGLWLREAVPEGQRVINAARAGRDGLRLHEVTVLTFDHDAGPLERIEAAEALLADGAWQLGTAKLWRLGDANPERSASLHATLHLPSELGEADLRDSFAAPFTISVWDLPVYIAQLERAGFAGLQHRVWLQMELAMPLFLMAMVLVGASFTLRHIRAGRQGLMVLLALLAGFGAFFLRNFTQVLGENGQIPVLLAAWTPPVVAALLALGLLLQLEEG